jgi:hypothetical protein
VILGQTTRVIAGAANGMGDDVIAARSARQSAAG